MYSGNISTLQTRPECNGQMQTGGPELPNSNKSSALIGLGYMQLLVSIGLFCCCMWIISLYSHFTANYVAVFSCIYHAFVAILAIYGGSNVSQKRRVIGVGMGLAIVGMSIIAGVTLWLVRDSWVVATTICISAQSGLDMFISIMSSCNIFQCCGAPPQNVTQGVIVRQIPMQPRYNP